MTRARTPLLLACLASAALAQALPDGPAFGGSKVFSLGLDSLGNSARFDQAPAGWYLGRVAGDLKPKDQESALDGLGTLGSDAAAQAAALAKLAATPWAQRTLGYSVSLVRAGGVHASLSREETTGLMATVDQDPAHRGTGLGLNATSLDLRRARVTRLVTGVGSLADGAAYGFAFRLEDWRFGQEVRRLNPLAGQVPLGVPKEALDFARTPDKRLTATLDGGALFEVAPGLRLGGMVNRLVASSIGDLKEQPQVRAGVQLDLGTLAQLSAEADLNEAVRLPFAAKQKSASVSLKVLAGPTAQLLLGAERRTLAGTAANSLGATLLLKFGGLQVGAGLRFGQDRPLTGLGLRIDG